MSAVLFERHAGLACATLSSPKSLNALSLEMIDLLYPQLLEWQQDDSVKVVWLAGQGERAFCAGGDIVALYRSMTEQTDGSRNRLAEDFFEREYRLDYLLHNFGKPIVCWGQGVVMGGGLGLLAGASHRIVTPSSRIAMPEITIGLYPDVGGSRFLSRMPGATGLFLGLTGARLNAADARYVGLADHLIADDKRDTLLTALADTNWGDDNRDNDTQVARLLRQHALAADAWPDDVVKPHFDVINDLCDADSLPEVVARISDYPGDDAWLTRAAATLAAGCPQTAWLVWEAQHRARSMSLAEVFRMEWMMSVQCTLRGDLKEGIRALLIDKDQQPQFNHHSVADVRPEDVTAFFERPAGVVSHPLADLGN